MTEEYKPKIVAVDSDRLIAMSKDKRYNPVYREDAEGRKWCLGYLAETKDGPICYNAKDDSSYTRWYSLSKRHLAKWWKKSLECHGWEVATHRNATIGTMKLKVDVAICYKKRLVGVIKIAEDSRLFQSFIEEAIKLGYVFHFARFGDANEYGGVDDLHEKLLISSKTLLGSAPNYGYGTKVDYLRELFQQSTDSLRNQVNQ